MIRSLLIANRGEIAVRIARTARSMGLRVIAVHTAAERDLPHVAAAHEAYEIGEGPVAESYLNGSRIIEVARAAGAEAIHPGYGFLAESESFARACGDAGILFVGPSPQAIAAMAGKDQAKRLMEEAGVPVTPGYHDADQDPASLERAARDIGLPVLIKAVAGGGGRGMRRVEEIADFASALEVCKREAKGAFGDDRVIIESFIPAPRHIEVQIVADRHGNVVHLFERDCSVQRRHQKVIEEAPAPGMDAATRAWIGEVAIQAARAVGYEGAGTVEFIADASEGLSSERIYFMEMNTRLQVEHPATEAVTGFDLVEWQLRIADGEALPVAQDKIALDGHAIEARIYAEDPSRDFLPSTGRLALAEWPSGSGIRVDSGYRTGNRMTSYFDPMLAKIIAHGSDRADALERLVGALDHTFVAGPQTNLAFLSSVLGDDRFRNTGVDTGYIDRALPKLTVGERRKAGVGQAIRVLLSPEGESPPDDPWAATDGFETNGVVREHGLAIAIDGLATDVRLRFGSEGLQIEGSEPLDDEPPAERIVRDGQTVYALRKGMQTVVTLDARSSHAGDKSVSAGGAIRAPMHGRISSLFVEEGDEVRQGARIFALEAMKMEHMVLATRAGRVSRLAISLGAQVEEGALALEIVDPDPAGDEWE